MQSIKNKFLQVSVKETGAELSSIKAVKSGKEYLWDGNPEVWNSQAPNLFPVIGCLKDNGFLYLFLQKITLNYYSKNFHLKVF